MKPVTDRVHRILLRASKAKDGALNCPEDYSVRIWMTCLNAMAGKGLIRRDGRVSCITDAGRAALQVKRPVKRRRASPALLGVNTPETGFAEVAG